MAHTRLINKSARIVDQCARGRFLRNVSSQRWSVAAARSDNTGANLIMADAIQNEASQKGFFVAPCNGTILGVYANGSPFIDMATSGTVYAQVYKSVGGDTDQAFLTDNSDSGIQVGTATVPTADTALDGTVSTVAGVANFTTGQHIYGVVTVSDHVVDASGYVTVNVEWMATDASYASS